MGYGLSAGLFYCGKAVLEPLPGFIDGTYREWIPDYAGRRSHVTADGVVGSCSRSDKFHKGLFARADVGNKDVHEYCRREHIPILLEIPLDLKIAHLYSEGTPLVAGLPEYRDKFIGLFAWIKEVTAGNGTV